MLPALAVNWVLLLLRAIVAVLFGVAVLFWPTPPTTALVLLFAAYAAVDGALALILALGAKGVPGFGSVEDPAARTRPGHDRAETAHFA